MVDPAETETEDGNPNRRQNFFSMTTGKGKVMKEAIFQSLSPRLNNLKSKTIRNQGKGIFPSPWMRDRKKERNKEIKK